VISDLEDKINEFLGSFNGKIIDVKFTVHAVIPTTSSLNYHYTVLILYASK
jgi:hypothetical protein